MLPFFSFFFAGGGIRSIEKWMNEHEDDGGVDWLYWERLDVGFEARVGYGSIDQINFSLHLN